MSSTEHETKPDSAEADPASEEATEQRELLIDREARVEAVEGDGPYGEPGRRFNRRSPFYMGLMGGLGLAVAYLVGWAVTSAEQELELILLAFFIAVGLEPVVAFLTRRGIRRGFSVLIVSLAAIGVLVGFLAIAIPPLVTQVDNLVKLAPHYLDTLNKRSSFLGHLNTKYHIVSHLQKALSGGGGASTASTVTSGVVGAGKVVLGAITALVIVVSLTIYFLADLPRVTTLCYRLVPFSRRARAGLLIDEVFARVGGYVLGNIITSGIAAVGTLVWLLIWGVPYALLLSVFVGFMDLIPIVGSTIAGIIVALVALTVGLPTAIATAIFYLVYRQAEDYLITPRIMQRTVNVSGLVTIIAVIMGGTLFGVIGALVAIPIGAAIKLVLEQVTFPRLDSS
ncbi:MAG TPA: AI-2E family transporter [Solirubrobacteraceae bacterium]|jgi:predicted PurR-regulated permease PerM|nr:AI-2E family transporter [Solirubrobacteraceae bacterium]